MVLFQKKSVLIFVVCIFIVSIGAIIYVTSPSESNKTIYNVVNLPANSITFSEAEKLDAFAELIVIGYATDGFADREHVITAFDDGAMQSFHTNTNIKITKILKKPEDFPSDQNELTIIEPVSLDGDIKYTANDYVELQQGETSVIFLLRNSYGDYGLINDNWGKFSLEGISQYSLPESSASQQLSEYSTFRDFVMKKYNLNQDS